MINLTEPLLTGIVRMAFSNSMRAKVIERMRQFIETSRCEPAPSVTSGLKRGRNDIWQQTNTNFLVKERQFTDRRSFPELIREVLTLLVLEPSGLSVPIDSIHVVTYNGRLYFQFTMQKMQGTLESELRKLTPVNKVKAIFECALLVYFMQSLRIHHRDIKPSNFLWNAGRLYISDLESARVRSSTDETQNSTQWRTPGYYAPEVRSGQYGLPADIWSLGVSLQNLSKAKAQVFEIGTKCLKKDPRERPSARQIVEEFIERVPDVSDDRKDEVRAEMQRRYSEVTKTVKEYQDINCTEREVIVSLLQTTWIDAVIGLHDNEDLEMYAFMFYSGFVFDRNLFCTLALLSKSNSAIADRVISLIRADKSPYARGCVALFEKKVEDAVKLFRDGIRMGCLLCLTELGCLLVKSKRPEERVKGEKLLEIAGKRGDLRAMFRIGLYLLSRDGDRKNEGIAWIRKAADCGHNASAWLLSHLFSEDISTSG